MIVGLEGGEQLGPIAVEIAFFFSGRLSVTYRTPSAASVIVISSVISDLLGELGRSGDRRGDLQRLEILGAKDHPGQPVGHDLIPTLGDPRRRTEEGTGIDVVVGTAAIASSLRPASQSS